ncbi:MAG: transaldolase family protein [bacterium]
MMTRRNYLRWLTEDTPTQWWHDSAIPEEITAGLANGALGVTTNPVLTYKTLQARPAFWRERVEEIPQSLAPEARAEALLRVVATHAAKAVEPVFVKTHGQHGYAFGQLNPTAATDAPAMLEMARRVAAWAPNLAVKLPTTQAGLEVMEELAAGGVAICATINFSVAQAVAVSESYRRGLRRARKNGVLVRPCFAVQQIGRLDDYLRDAAKDAKLDLTEAELRQSGLAVAKRAYEIAEREGYEAVIMPAGLRGVYHLTELAGARMTFSLHPRVQQMILDADPKPECRIAIPIEKKVIDRLRGLPEFVRAYEPDGLAPREFFTFGVAQKTLSQFVETGWAPLEVYGSNNASSRWT